MEGEIIAWPRPRLFQACGRHRLEWSRARFHRTVQSRPALRNCLDELEKVVKELEGGDLPLERSLELFEKGMSLSDTCRKQLEEAETRVEMLIRKEGKLQAEPFRPEKA